MSFIIIKFGKWSDNMLSNFHFLHLYLIFLINYKNYLIDLKIDHNKFIPFINHFKDQALINDGIVNEAFYDLNNQDIKDCLSLNEYYYIWNIYEASNLSFDEFFKLKNINFYFPTYDWVIWDDG